MLQTASDLLEASVRTFLALVVPAALVALGAWFLIGDGLAGVGLGLLVLLGLGGLRFVVTPLWRLVTTREVPATFVEIVGRAAFGRARRGWAFAVFEADGKRIELRFREGKARRFARALVPGRTGELRFSGRLLRSWAAD
jgi:hypothetical protein